MLGAIIGDIVGSVYEFDNHRSKEFPLFTRRCTPTDDSIMTLAVAQSILNAGTDYMRLEEEAVANMRALGAEYPGADYGGRFCSWLRTYDPKPYGSYGNGAAMRVSPCGFAASSLEEAIRMSDAVTKVTHNHPEGMKGAEATTVAIYMARTGKNKDEIREIIERDYYKLDFTLDEIRPTYYFNETCQNTVPQAIEAFLESASFEDAIRNAISIGGDSDTLAAITGSIAEAFYGIPSNIRKLSLPYLDATQLSILNAFESKYGIIEEKKLKTLISDQPYQAHAMLLYLQQKRRNIQISISCDASL